MKFVGEKFRYSKHLQKHVEDNHKNVGTVEYFRRYILKEPDEKFGKCLICGEPLEVKRRNFSFIWKTGFSKHWHQKCSTATKEHWILMFGEEEGLKKWNHYCELQSKTNTFEYKKEKYGWTKEDFDAYNKTRAITLENQIAKYGEEEGTKRFKEYCDKQSYAGCKLEYFIEKYGEVEGKKKYEEVNAKKSLTVDTFINKYGEEEGVIRYHNYMDSKRKCRFFQ